MIKTEIKHDLYYLAVDELFANTDDVEELDDLYQMKKKRTALEEDKNIEYIFKIERRGNKEEPVFTDDIQIKITDKDYNELYTVNYVIWDNAELYTTLASKNISKDDTLSYLIPKNENNMSIFYSGNLDNNINISNLQKQINQAKNNLSTIMSKTKTK